MADGVPRENQEAYSLFQRKRLGKSLAARYFEKERERSFCRDLRAHFTHTGYNIRILWCVYTATLLYLDSVYTYTRRTRLYSA